MVTRFPCLRVEGGFFAAELLDEIADGKAHGQKPADFGLEKGTHLIDEISIAWSSVRAHFDAFKRRLEKLQKDDPATSITRDQWMIPFFSLLGYELAYQTRAADVDGQTYAVSHRDGKKEEGLPVHIVGYNQSLDRRPDTGRPRLAPHSLMQDYLNRTEHLWGIAANGKILRVLRDSQLMRRQAYLEFDLEQMIETEKFSDFALLFRLAHRTRFPKTMEDASKCLLEDYYQTTVKQGGRVRDGLREGVEKALKIFAEGFLSHPRGAELVKKAKEESLKPLAFYQQLLRLIYRLLFLMVSEERNLITDHSVYHEQYSVSRLRKLCEQNAVFTDHEDLWLSLKTTFLLFQDESTGKTLNVPPLNGDLFNASQTEELNALSLTNRFFLTALRHLSMYRETPSSPLRRINYAALDVEELGSVYESLLDFQPVFMERDGKCVFELTLGTQRKSTGSYYTPPELVNELIKSALIPVMDERLKAEKDAKKKEEAILNVKVCDPACGSGHFLLAAARTLGRALAKIRSGDDEPSPEHTRLAIRDVITHCIYGVDKNPLAVDLCKVALWMEGHAQGKPLTFLDHRVKCGDSLVGVLNMDILKEGIPDEAYSPITGDDKAIARSLKKQNKEERKGQRALPFVSKQKAQNDSEAYRILTELPDDTPEHIRKKSEAYKKIRSHGSTLWQDMTACHLWTAAFFVELTKESQDNHRIPTTDSLRRYMETHTEHGQLTGYAWMLAQRYNFFHWQLEFPEVFEQGGFDVVLGNPPWERIKLQEQEFFETREETIAQAPNKAARMQLIQRLKENNPSLYQEFQKAKHSAEAESRFLRSSERFPLTARGDINTYAVFAEGARRLISERGRCGIIVPTGIATDDNCKQFFSDLVEREALVSLYDFENREAIFSAVHRSYKFSLFTVGGSGRKNSDMTFTFFATRVDHLKDEMRNFTLKSKDFHLLNPNTHTCPVFRTKVDAELNKKLYRHVPVLDNEKTRENPLGAYYMRLVDLSDHAQFVRFPWEDRDSDWDVPLYESKLIWMFDHHFGTFADCERSNFFAGHPREPLDEEKYNPYLSVSPRYFVPRALVDDLFRKYQGYVRPWLLVWRDVTNATNERTCITTVIPRVAATRKCPALGFNSTVSPVLLLANLNCLVLDYSVRQKIGGMSLSYFILKQLPVLPPSTYTPDDIAFITPRVLELVYTAWDIKAFADDVWREADENFRLLIKNQWEENKKITGGHTWNPPQWAEIAEDGIPLPPFKWDEERRAVLRAELDAYYARLYGLTHDELRYILDPKDVYGEDFPGETFRVLKDKETRKFGEYRTRRLVMEAWEGLSKTAQGAF